MDFKLIFLSLLPVLIFTILSRADQALSSDQNWHVSHHNRAALAAAGGVGKVALKGRKQTSGCNLFQGRWVPDASYPFYNSSMCPFIDSELNCFGRPDKQFLKYSWQPDSCSIPRFDGQAFLNKWRGKRVMFVGDSLSLNMWESLACMIHSSVPDSKTTFIKRTPLSSLTFQEYGVTLYLYRTPYLVDISKEDVGRVLNLGTIEGGADVWKDMDILVFNSWHWWLHKGVQSQGWDFIRNGSSLIRDMDRLDAFNKGLTTWAQWVDQNVNISQTRVFFQGISPTHYMGREWNEPRKTCNGQMQPLTGSTYPGGSLPAVSIVSRVLSSMKTPVYLLDITTLSQLRKDAHPSTYGGDGGTDCSHWCLPGLPDTWNQLLYAALSM
ncbi:Protein trichome birefringence-like 37 [Raphanus sativus]|uniref:Protein trichome birefringence-like 37 isoform X1 n=2 Tax=Raphanus sativus TaxID=3726 RepID=A0A6J0MUY3_RAPSA|nr:protein trichome birefringence-like 37 isoform X1 [Raphanus sativus]KAJ4907120.1 Protein trichome birefringence-like 37 [Raphanus sativus]